MRILIIGDGKIGSALAEQLCREGHKITIIDRSGEPLEQTGKDLDILCIEGNGATAAVQQEAGVSDADLLIAVTASDEMNLLCCLLGKKLGARHTIARVRIPEYDEELSLISQELGLSLSVNPDLICASEMARSLRVAQAIKADSFAGGRVELLQLRVPGGSMLSGKKLMELPELTRAKVLICAVERGEELFIPTGTFTLEEGDHISVVASPRSAQAFFKKAKLAASPIRSVMLAGGGFISFYLAKQLLDSGMDVTIIESSYERCQLLSELLPKASILHGDGTDEAFLRESGLAQADAFATLTGIDEENLLMSLYVRKTFPNIKVLTKINRRPFSNILGSLDVGSVYNPRTSASNLICRYVRAMDNTGSKVETLYKLVGGRVEALEFKVASTAPFCGVSLQNLKIRENTLIAAIMRSGRVIIPSGQDTLEPGDSVIVVTTEAGISDLSRILEERK